MLTTWLHAFALHGSFQEGPQSKHCASQHIVLSQDSVIDNAAIQDVFKLYLLND